MDALDVSSHIELQPVHADAITSLSLDAVDGRYLLSSGADGSVAIYDIEDRPRDPLLIPTSAGLQPVVTLSRQHAGAHKQCVSAVDWHPHDTGVFFSAGFDGTVKLWDTNELSVACEFLMAGRVFSIASVTTRSHDATQALARSS